MERIVEEISFDAPDRYVREAAGVGEGATVEVVIGKEDVDRVVRDLMQKTDLMKYVL